MSKYFKLKVRSDLKLSLAGVVLVFDEVVRQFEFAVQKHPFFFYRAVLEPQDPFAMVLPLMPIPSVS